MSVEKKRLEEAVKAMRTLQEQAKKGAKKVTEEVEEGEATEE